ncbi:hypothetical protein BV25DRAFT_643734 [Artomyces pyxidatus]|uniref:Uncharacterized protein n=1 Tax=Artomyces pyxidatus TaxID=48021 RepID=A0ACB8T344_9AGAM|nr:hypothetical protein BV25DRAFT_643734 [Artomyces pyxidatus]
MTFTETYADEVRNQIIFNHVQVATLALYVYDWIILFGEEVDLIWQARWTLPKVLFLLSRYTPFLDLALNLVHNFADLDPKGCSFTFSIISWSMTIGMAVSEVVMILRVQVLYDRSKKITIFLTTLWTILTAAGVVFIYLSTRNLTFTTISSLGLAGCQPQTTTNTDLTLLGSFLSLLVMQTVIVMLTLGNAYVRWRTRYRFETLDLTLKTLYLDGVLFFLFLLAFGYVNILYPIITVEPDLSHIFFAPMRAFHGLLSCRLLLNIRRVASSRVVLPRTSNPPLSLIPTPTGEAYILEDEEGGDTRADSPSRRDRNVSGRR